MLLHNDYEANLRKLLTLKPGKERLNYWNELFNVHILEDVPITYMLVYLI